MNTPAVSTLNGRSLGRKNGQENDGAMMARLRTFTRNRIFHNLLSTEYYFTWQILLHYIPFFFHSFLHFIVGLRISTHLRATRNQNGKQLCRNM